MDNEYMYQEAIGNIKYQAHKITYLANGFNASLIDAINLFLKSGNNNVNPVDNDVFFKAQVNADSLLNAYASLIDYYYIAIAIKMNAPLDVINSVQYKKITNELIAKKESWSKYLQHLKPILEEKFEPENDIWNEFYFMWGGVFKQELVKWRVLKTEDPAFSELTKENGKIDILPNEVVLEYYRLTHFLYCNRTGSGHKYNIYLELNNYLKHNRYPLVKYETQRLKDGDYAYAFYTIHQNEYHLLKAGIIRTFAEIDFDTLKEGLKHCYENRGVISSLEMEIGLPIINVDRANGYESNSCLYFQLDGVLMSRSVDSISVNAHSLFSVSGSLLREISNALDCKLIPDI
ncbi:hypothetical protein ACJLW5_003203 [Enterobacter hormaechei]|nr:hypothetical protein [Enterobacter hormaechei]MCU2332474.1 hypothetical protein [Enterobacter hormaechei subsp. steigerwaltii]EMA2156259.1 hypothetical protein [Enterobacter hormaechei]MCM7625828.1 hypothetical protein [Enterobacter hormaechei]MCM7849505.1 hypothetical protein [Enterobacter hormaechei]MCW4684506.1 hypothetical protein [Enterobacter hormaechei subsp. xiangfangensis]